MGVGQRECTCEVGGEGGGAVTPKSPNTVAYTANSNNAPASSTSVPLKTWTYSSPRLEWLLPNLEHTQAVTQQNDRLH